LTAGADPSRPARAVIDVAPLERDDLPEADRVLRLAFGTARGLPEPEEFARGSDMVATRWAADPSSAFKATVEGELVGCAFATRWGSVALFGPLAVRPDHWDHGVGRALWEARLPLLDRWRSTHAGLFTNAASTKHVHLYQQFGFWPRFLTSVLAKEPRARSTGEYVVLSALDERRRARAVERCRDVTDALYPGLDLEREIRAVAEQGLGETLLAGDPDAPEGFAVCHLGEGSEAGPDTAFVKFAAVRPGAGAADRFEQLLDAIEEHASEAGVERLVAGVNLARHDAYRMLLARGFRAFLQGVAMQRPNQPGFNRPDVFAIDDWR
jgi:N-acetylglutamate synthase-like GNAT family acetyltransferase